MSKVVPHLWKSASRILSAHDLYRMNDPTMQIDEGAARARFDKALDEYAQAFETFFLARLLDLGFAYLPEDAADEDKQLCRITFPAEDFLFNPQGSLHGGTIATVMDISMGHLINKVAGAGATIEMKIQYMRPVTSGLVTVEGRFVRRGRNLSFLESKLLDAEDQLCAMATATWKMPRA